jgi:hypothetical protein
MLPDGTPSLRSGSASMSGQPRLTERNFSNNTIGASDGEMRK